VTIFEVADAAKKAGHNGLADQMKESVESIGSNIAEGSGHSSRKEFARYLSYSIASACELESQVNLATRVHVITWSQKEALDKEVEGVRKMLTRLRGKIDIA
jgi:four helix bundle protein